MPIDRRTFFFYLYAGGALVFSLYVIAVHIGFTTLPILALGAGAGLAFLPGDTGLKLFLFVLPLVNSLPALWFNGFPFNLMGTLLFLLAGLVIGAVIKGEAPGFQHLNWAGPYLFFLSLIWISAIFLLLRWSNITLPSGAFFEDTPVGPGLPLSPRISFAVVFPAITLLIFSMAPFSAALIKKFKLSGRRVLQYVMAGYAGSVLIAFVQKFIDNGFLSISWWGERMSQYNGGSSDFNGFGFLGGAVFLSAALTLMNRKKRSDAEIMKKELVFYYIVLAVSFTGIIFSGSRTAFIFMIFAFVFLLFSRASLKIKIIFPLLVLLLLSITGGNLKERLDKSVRVRNDKEKSMVEKLDDLTNGRIRMILESVPMVAKYPVSGIGAGNFLFYLKYRNYGSKFLEDLPLNQYLLFLDELGIIGLGAFLLFLWPLLRGRERNPCVYLFRVILLVMLVGNSLWLPEIAVFFFILTPFVSGGDVPPAKKNLRYAALLLILLFITGNILSFYSLHPSKLMADRGLSYDFGFWEESVDTGFRWTRKAAGMLLKFDENGEYGPVTFFSGAPLGHLPHRVQSLKVYVNGKMQGSKDFRVNEEYSTRLKGDPEKPFLLRIEASPVFNLKKMGLGPESRDLGIQFFSVPEGP